MTTLPLQTLFYRAYNLTVGPQTGGKSFQYGNTAGTTSALRVAFEIDKIAQGAASKGTITLYNISQATRNALVQNFQVVLKAGYFGLIDTLFAGAIFKATSQRQGPDITTTLNVLDGLTSVLYSRFDKSYPPNTALWQIVQDVAKSMDVEAGVVIGLPNEKFGRGFAAHGLCVNILHQLLDPYGRRFFINNNKLNILPNDGTLGTSAIVLSPESGLLGVPSVNPTCVTFEALLNPRITPGQIVQLVTQNPATAGFFTIRSAKIAGDTHDNTWTVSCECVRSPNVKGSVGAAHGFAYNTAVIDGLI